MYSSQIKSRDSDHHFRISTFWIYSVAFALGSLLFFFPYIKNGLSLVDSTDAMQQHYIALSYWGQYLRNLFHDIFVEHTFHIPTWDLSLGYGADIITTLHYYCLGEPLTLLSAFFSPAHTEICYEILIILRLYLAGFFFLMYCRYMNFQRFGALLGALTYTFSGYAAGPCVFHPFFAIPMICFPLLLLGAEKVYRKENPLTFILAVTLAAISNYYFFYMQVLLLIGYLILRYFSFFSPFRLKECMRWIGRFLLYALIGLAIAAPIFIPNISSILQSTRASAKHIIPLFYPASYYKNIAGAFLSVYSDYYLYIATGALGLLSIFSVYCLPKTRSSIFKIGIPLLLFIALVPALGSAFNAFSYATNRWIWALNFLIGISVAVYFPELEHLQTDRLKYISIAAVSYIVLAEIFPEARNLHLHISVIILIFCVGCIALRTFQRISQKTLRVSVTCAVFITITLNGYFWASPAGHHWNRYSLPQGEADNRYAASPLEEISSFPGSDQVRVDWDSIPLPYNNALFWNLNSTSYYFSPIDPGTSSFQRSQMMPFNMEQMYSGLDRRAYLQAAMGVSYYINTDESINSLPYGYDNQLVDTYYNVYTSPNTLPLVYAFDSICSNGENLNTVQRQQALLQCAITTHPCSLPEANLHFREQMLDYTVEASEGIQLSDHKILVTKEGAELTLSFSPVTEGELYFIIKGADWNAANPDSGDEAGIAVRSGQNQKAFCITKPTANFYCGFNDFLVNLGYFTEETDSLQLYFPSVGEYEYDDISVAFQPLDHLSEEVDSLRNSGISNIHIDKDVVNFTSCRNSDGIACAMVPYQKGWTATIDGNPTDVFEVQNGFCGILVPSGNHNIVLEYHTYLWEVYIFIACVGLIAAIILCTSCKYHITHRRTAAFRRS